MHRIQVRDRECRGSNTIRLQIQLQATTTFLSLQQWQNYDPEAEGNSQSERDQLWEDYITELNILKVLIQTKRTEEDMIWSSIDSIAIEECLDSISMIEMKAYKYMTHIDELSDNEKADIIQYAKRCATQYGHGIHLMRSIASRFDDTDYREYDLDCEESMQDGYRNQEIEYRKSQSGITIVPNPNNGTFSINHSNNLEVTQVTIRDIQGMEVYNQVGVSQGEHIQINVSSGLYIISMEYNNGKIESQKIIISK